MVADEYGLELRLGRWIISPAGNRIKATFTRSYVGGGRSDSDQIEVFLKVKKGNAEIDSWRAFRTSGAIR